MIYTLLLTSQNATSNPKTSNSIWNINWDDLFNTNNLKPEYRTCRVKFEINSTTLQSTTATYDYKARNGYLTANFATTNQGTQQGQSIVGGCILGTLSVEPTMYWYNGTSSVNTYISYRNSTLATKGVEILTPTGVGALNVGMYCLESTGGITPSLMSYDDEFTLILQFDFDDE
jgi:hypothetical protein